MIAGLADAGIVLVAKAVLIAGLVVGVAAAAAASMLMLGWSIITNWAGGKLVISWLSGVGCEWKFSKAAPAPPRELAERALSYLFVRL